MIVYLAHPVGSDSEIRKQNLENVQKWFLWLFHNTDWTINVPWFIYVANLDESHKKRCLRDDLRVLNTCDAIVLTGGRISPGMFEELGLAIANGAKIFDLVSLGYDAPQTHEQTQKALEIITGVS